MMPVVVMMVVMMPVFRWPVGIAHVATTLVRINR